MSFSRVIILMGCDQGGFGVLQHRLPAKAEGERRFPEGPLARQEGGTAGRVQPFPSRVWDVKSDSSASKLSYFPSLIIFARAQFREQDCSANHIPLEASVINKLHPSSRNNFP